MIFPHTPIRPPHQNNAKLALGAKANNRSLQVLEQVQACLSWRLFVSEPSGPAQWPSAPRAGKSSDRVASITSEPCSKAPAVISRRETPCSSPSKPPPSPIRTQACVDSWPSPGARSALGKHMPFGSLTLAPVGQLRYRLSKRESLRWISVTITIVTVRSPTSGTVSC